MAKRKQSTPAARAARDMLLKRAAWITDSNILMGCGYTPLLPPDLHTFMQPGLPQPQILSGLLKSVMPAINLADDLTGPKVPHGLTPMEQGDRILECVNEGIMDLPDAHLRLDALQKLMNMQDTIVLMNAIKEHNER